MAILVMCSNSRCGELFEASDDAAGSEVCCPACGAKNVVGQAPQTPRRAEADTPPSPQAPVQPAQQQPDEPDLTSLPAVAEDELPPRPRESTREPPSPDEPIDLSPLAEERPASEAAPATGTAAPAEQIETDEALERLFGDLPAMEIDEIAGDQAAIEAEEPGVLRYRMVAPVLLAVGLLGMLGGMAAGVGWFPAHPVWAAYVGAALGWVIGFIFAFLVVLAGARESPEQVRCALCQNVFPVGTQACRFCGSSLLVGGPATLATSCLRVGPYMRSNLFSVYWLALLAVGAYVLYAVTGWLTEAYPVLLRPYRGLLLCLCGLVALYVLAIWMQFFLRAIAGTLGKAAKAPDAWRHLGLRDAADGLLALAAIALYLVPIFSMPLLPLSLLLLSAPGKTDTFNPARVARTAWRGAKNYANLWLMILMWAAGLMLAIIVVRMCLRQAERLLPFVEGASRIELSIILSAVEIGLDGAFVCVFGLAICRCIGLFGRQNAPLLCRDVKCRPDLVTDSQD